MHHAGAQIWIIYCLPCLVGHPRGLRTKTSRKFVGSLQSRMMGVGRRFGYGRERVAVYSCLKDKGFSCNEACCSYRRFRATHSLRDIPAVKLYKNVLNYLKMFRYCHLGNSFKRKEYQKFQIILQGPNLLSKHPLIPRDTDNKHPLYFDRCDWINIRK